MMRGAAIVLCVAAAACSPRRDPARIRTALENRAHDVAARLGAADSAARAGHPSEEPIAQWILPHHYDEISGLTLTRDGRLLAHGDETAEIWEIDYRRGVVTKAFGFGSPTVTGDFEAITSAGDKLYLLTSDGRIYEGSEGKAGDPMAYNEYDTRLTRECEFEGMVHDPSSGSLILACKNIRSKAPKGALVLYRWPLPGSDSAARGVEQIVIPIERFNALGPDWKSFDASDITRDPRSGTFVVISSAERGIAEITLDGRVLRAGNLPGRHVMPEGVAVTQQGWLLVSDEANGQQPVLTVYPTFLP